jgi:ABC-type Mn2+/Zn2+ transport system ATPase subunit
MRVSAGQLVMVVGQVGSGKSTLVNSLLGEVPQLRGTRDCNGSVAFVPQQVRLSLVAVYRSALLVQVHVARSVFMRADRCRRGS